MAMSEAQRQIESKDEIIKNILKEENLYKIIGAPRSASQSELRRYYLERSKICHPDKPPPHPLSTAAFQRLGFAFDILKTPTTRRSYDVASHPSTRDLPEKTTFLGGEHTFRTAVLALLSEFMTGDFILIRRFLSSLHTRYPNLISSDTVQNVEWAFVRIRELVMTTRVYGLIIYVELGRVERVRKRLMAVGMWDIVGRAKLGVHLVRVAIAVPMRVDRKLREREERLWNARMAGLQAREVEDLEKKAGGILNEKVVKVLGFIVGEAGKDEGDENWADGIC